MPRSNKIMLNPLKLLFFIVTAALEVTLLHFGTALLALAFRSAPGLNWFVLLLVCLIAAWATQRFMTVSDDDEPGGFNRPLALVFALTIGYSVKVQAGGGWSPLSGWSLLWPLAAGSPNTVTLAGLLFVQLWAWWRGMALIDHDHGAVVSLLQNGVLVLALLTILVTPLTQVNLGAPPWGPLLATEAAALIIFGLLSLALARITVDEERRPENGWRWFRSSLATTLGLIVVGLLLLALVSNAATEVIRAVLAVTIGTIALLLSPLVSALTRLLLWLSSAGSADPLAQPSPAPSGLAEAYPAPPSELEGQLIRTLFMVFSTLLYLVPLLLLLLAIVLLRRRRRATPSLDGAVYESLWSRQRLADDLRGLLSGLRLRGGQSLRDALARLRGGDPVVRIRRRYVQALLLGAEAGHERRPPQTPLEYQADLSDVVPEPGRAWQTMTDTYDRARYAPETIQPADADAMDAAWATIQAQSKENR